MSVAGQEGFGLTSVNNFSGFWGIGSVPSCIVPGPGVIRARGQWSRAGDLIKEVVGGTGSRCLFAYEKTHSQRSSLLSLGIS